MNKSSFALALMVCSPTLGCGGTIEESPEEMSVIAPLPTAAMLAPTPTSMPAPSTPTAAPPTSIAASSTSTLAPPTSMAVPSAPTTAPPTSMAAPATPSTSPLPTASPPPTASGVTGTLVPLYTFPGDPSWSSVIAAKSAHPSVPVVAVINPASGPGNTANDAYTSGIGSLHAVGVTVIGYVSTVYADRGIDVVNADIDRWNSFYPELDGIFFDEQSNSPGDEGFYREVSAYAKSLGLNLTVGNPGTKTAESFVGTVDVQLIYESQGVPSEAAIAGYDAFSPTNFGIIPYATSLDAEFIAIAKKHVGYIYLTGDDLPNPWDSIPSYFDDLLAALE